jgi:hypothetical protein
MQSRGGAPLVEVSVAADRVIGVEHLHVNPAPLELLDHGPRRAQPAVRPSTEYQPLGELVLDLTEVLDRKRVTLPPPPVRQDAVRQHDQVPGLLLAVHDDPPEAVVLKPGHADDSTPASCADLTRGKELDRRPHREEGERAFEIADALELRRFHLRSRRQALAAA